MVPQPTPMRQVIKANKRNSISGFTLTEILAVIVVIGILAATALPRFGPQREKAVVAEAVGILSAIRQAEEAYFFRNDTYYDPLAAGNSWLTLGLDDPTNTTNGKWKYIFAPLSVTATTFIARAERCTGTAPTWTCNAAIYVQINQIGSYANSTHPNAPRD